MDGLEEDYDDILEKMDEQIGHLGESLGHLFWDLHHALKADVMWNTRAGPLRKIVEGWLLLPFAQSIMEETREEYKRSFTPSWVKDAYDM